jgi:hypothetical protein
MERFPDEEAGNLTFRPREVRDDRPPHGADRHVLRLCAAARTAPDRSVVYACLASSDRTCVICVLPLKNARRHVKVVGPKAGSSNNFCLWAATGVCGSRFRILAWRRSVIAAALTHE